MIGGWLIKVVVGIAFIAFAVIELGSPFVARAQADDAAHEVADEASFRLRDTFDDPTLQAACTSEGVKQSVEIVLCDFDREKDQVVVRVKKQARSYLLHRFSATKDWYEVEASARADRR